MNGERTLRAALWGAAGFALGYLLPGTLRLPVLAYDPVRRALLVTSSLTGAQMRYAGDLLWACGAALGASCLGRALPQRRPFDARVSTVAVLSLFALDVAFYLSRLLAAV
ncbi:MAG TPA: hypothetical protein VN874_02900 [Myxococcales bacterium]|nr:hypothetical protein [Myxococcales bacterium]